MGHSIEHYSYPVTMSKDKIYKGLNEYVRHATWQEGGSGVGEIRWYDSPILKSYDEAMAFLESNDKGWYDQLAVKYRELIKGVNSEKLMELERKKKEAIEYYHTIRTKVYAKDYKADYIGCKGCGSKLSRKHLQSNMCPLCGYDMRSDAVKKSIEDAHLKIFKIEKQIEQEKEKLMKKGSELKWLIKIEYHI